jgi:hypothetical protein
LLHVSIVLLAICIQVGQFDETYVWKKTTLDVFIRGSLLNELIEWYRSDSASKDQARKDSETYASKREGCNIGGDRMKSKLRVWCHLYSLDNLGAKAMQ